MKSEKRRKIPVYGKLKNFVIDQNLDQQLTKAAISEKCSVSHLIRRFCHEALESMDTNSRTTKP